MSKNNEPIVVRLKKNGKTFEVLTNHNTVENWKESKKEEDWNKVCVVLEIFKDNKKGKITKTKSK